MTSADVLDVLVVGWYPAGDDTFAGRFIADQVAALVATGRVRPTVAAFENLPLVGDERLRSRQELAIDANVAAATRSDAGGYEPEGAFGAPNVPVARLGIAAGAVPGLGSNHQEVHRRRSLIALVDATTRWPRLVHGHVGYPEGAAASSAAARMGVPFVLTEHATFLATFFENPVLRQRYLVTARAAARIVTVSHVLGRELVAEFPELEPRVVPIPNTVAVDAFRVVPLDLRRPAELLWVGYRKQVKGLDTLLRAFQLVRVIRPDLRLRLVGRSSTDEEEAGWRRMAADLGIDTAVDFDGPADRAGVAAAMERATLFVHPSTRETFGVVAVEALSTGLPVVACDSGGVTEVLGDDPAPLGAIVPHSRPEALAAAILATLDRRTAFDPRVMRATVEARFGARAVADRIVELYDEVLEEGESRRTTQGTVGRPGNGIGGDANGKSGGFLGGAEAARPSREPGAADERWHPAAPRYVVVGFQRTVLDRHLLATPRWALAGIEIVTTGEAFELGGSSDAPAGRRPTSALASAAAGGSIARVTLARPGTDRRVIELVRWGVPPSGPRPLGWRIRRVAMAPMRWLRRLRRRAWLEPAVLGELDRTLARALQPGEGGDADGRVILVCLGGLDQLVARPFVESGRGLIAQGALRWLADRRWPPPSAGGGKTS